MSNKSMPSVKKLIDRWFPSPGAFTIQALQNHSGLSGAQLWKLTSNDQQFCLRRWPEYIPRERLEEIHRLLIHLDNRGSQLTPTPLPTLHGQTIVQAGKSHWELTEWLPGEALVAERPSSLHIAAALEKLAEIHLLAVNLSTGSFACRQRSPGLARRDEILRTTNCQQLASALTDCPASLLPSLSKACDLLQASLATIRREVAIAAQFPLPMQWRIGDIHHEHVLFTNNCVTGIVDFGAADIDSPIADVARLLGSMAGDDASLWRAGLAAYQSVRLLSAEELAALVAFDSGGAAVAVIRWIRWLGVEQRDFPLEKVRDRLDFLNRRLESLAKRGGASLI